MADSGYNTKQRQCILRCLTENRDRHFTVDELYDFLTEAGVKIGKTTCYRYLEKLVSEGCVRKFIADGRESACFQYIDSHDCCNSHFHLKCACCGRLFHLECGYLSDMESHIRDDHDFEIDCSRTVLYGKCAECLRKLRGNQ